MTGCGGQVDRELWYTGEHTFERSAMFKLWKNSRGIALFQVMKPQIIWAAAPEGRS
jgi:hypothetical protein